MFLVACCLLLVACFFYRPLHNLHNSGGHPGVSRSSHEAINQVNVTSITLLYLRICTIIITNIAYPLRLVTQS